MINRGRNGIAANQHCDIRNEAPVNEITKGVGVFIKTAEEDIYRWWGARFSWFIDRYMVIHTMLKQER